MKHCVRNILLIGFLTLTGCATQQMQSMAPVGDTPTTLDVLLSTEDAWRLVMRFADKNEYHLVNLDSDKGMMELAGSDTVTSGYNAYGFHYTILFLGLEKGTRIVIEGSFCNSEGKEVPGRDAMEKLRKTNEYRLMTALKKYFETELNHGSAKAKLS